jgi:hypothetical protein
MKRQKEMVESFLLAHREFMGNLNDSINIIERDIQEAADFDKECTGEWCTTMETSIDELAKFIYSISEPRWLSEEDSRMIRDMRYKIHDIYSRFKGLNARSGRT